jgi:hypothetical protein
LPVAEPEAVSAESQESAEAEEEEEEENFDSYREWSIVLCSLISLLKRHQRGELRLETVSFDIELLSK